MPLKATGQAIFDPDDGWAGGTTWIAHPEESMQRASHALFVDDAVWLVDPVDADGLDDHLADLGDVAGVVVLLDRHKRDADAIALRHDVPVYVPEWMDGVATEMTAPVERFGTTLADTYTVYPIKDSRFWQEAALYDEDEGTLVIPEAVGTASYFRTGDERIGVHPMLRLKPPRRLREFSPERILVGHGDPVVTEASDALADAIDGARRRIPALYVDAAKDFIFG
ncbi:Metallo-beta-lactamase superfamily enzyme [Halorhabdus sp. SVX81]|uniref:hypothetical protein n=1 Tax=Halorhabdus sp. SVX81 TaxID=2978283 RepID=UPI0023D99CD1|nr:hypothetical protein [Halorhabdus sp. SVX81]WEL18099.1 Metallo-beta-lactamase superfamily enzyme [Halorhabdus sp. SVX81]